MSVEVRQLKSDDIDLMHALLTTFGEVFDDADTYIENRPRPGYLRQLLGGESFIALVALKADKVVGGLAAYEFNKFEQERREIHIYDLAVAAEHRRQGIARQLIEKVKRIAAQRGVYLVFVQADTGIEDEPAIALYTKFGTREDVLHFDIKIGDGNGAA